VSKIDNNSFEVLAYFMKLLGIGLVLFFVIYAGVLVAVTKSNVDDSRAIKRYVSSRGAAPVPKTWRSKLGEGI